ncbi:MAG: GTPase ObgE, partial [Pirellulaceae bacterium]|nr:GTPase ObgE [Pirellulaceae bacterium]
DESNPVDNYLSIRRELTEYRHQLEERPEILAVTKSELPNAKEIRDQLQEKTDSEVLLISAVTGDGLPKLLQRVVSQLDESP